MFLFCFFLSLALSPSRCDSHHAELSIFSLCAAEGGSLLTASSYSLSGRPIRMQCTWRSTCIEMPRSAKSPHLLSAPREQENDTSGEKKSQGRCPNVSPPCFRMVKPVCEIPVNIVTQYQSKFLQNSGGLSWLFCGCKPRQST